MEAKIIKVNVPSVLEKHADALGVPVKALTVVQQQRAVFNAFAAADIKIKPKQWTHIAYTFNEPT